MPGARESRSLAESLEADAAEYPEDRGELLLEAMVAWGHAGRPERAHEIADELVAAGGVDGCYARYQRAELLIQHGQRERADAELAELARDTDLTDGPCQAVAELLEELGDLEAASVWYDRAVARLDDEMVAELRGPYAGWSYASTVVRGRRQVRERLGLPEDATDTLVPAVPSLADLGRTPSTAEEALEHLGAGGAIPHLRPLVFRRDERAEARRRWPETYTGSDEEYFAATERRWRELRESGVHSIRVVPVTVAGLVEFAERTGGSPTDTTVKTRYSATVADTVGMSWPPPRNAACWCGSGVKYKKCCGRPVSTAAG